MGTGFTVDSPLQVARYGISSVISLVDDLLIEQMRRHHSERAGEPCEPIRDREPDARARRITAYLDLLQRLIGRQVEALRASPFEPGSEITRYYDLLPENALKQRYREMLELVHASITHPQQVDKAGTCGRENGCRCGCCYVRHDREARESGAAAGE